MKSPAMFEQLELPLTRWDEEAMIRLEDGRRIKRWGSVQEARKILWGCGKTKVHTLIKAGVIRAAKMGDRNCHFKVDLLSAWEFKQRAELETGSRSFFE